MASKRDRQEFEADLRAQQSPFALYGTPLPPTDPNVKDAGSFVPIWKQEVLDDRGRKRLHGAFKGGFSAGYFNTVGSKEGWTPSSFVSSRSNRQSKDSLTEEELRAKYMDDEDLAEAAEAQILETDTAFSSLGRTSTRSNVSQTVFSLNSLHGDSLGLNLLRKMGWKDGEGVGAGLGSRARLEGARSTYRVSAHTRQDDQPIILERKTDRKGLGFVPGIDLSGRNASKIGTDSASEPRARSFIRPLSDSESQKKRGSMRNAISAAVLHENDSEEDSYEIGPKIRPYRILGGTRPTRVKVTKSIAAGPPSLAQGMRLKFQTRERRARHDDKRAGHDGSFALEGFTIFDTIDNYANDYEQAERFPVPRPPPEWKPAKPDVEHNSNSSFNEHHSAAAVAKLSRLDPVSRAKILDEKLLPGKSVFDYVPATSRDHIAHITGRSDLPAGRGESSTSQDKSDKLDDWMIPPLSKEVALAALGRGVAGWMPYADDNGKRSRYRAFLEFCGGIRPHLTIKGAKVARDSFLQELKEFAHAAAVFKPMTGLMASKFTSAASTASSNTGATPAAGHVPLKSRDAAEEAANAGMFGPLTRSSFRFYPTRLVCKRFSLTPPPHATVEGDERQGVSSALPQTLAAGGAASLESTSHMMHNRVSFSRPDSTHVDTMTEAEQQGVNTTLYVVPQPEAVDSSRNEALETERAGEAIFQAVFGNDSETD